MYKTAIAGLIRGFIGALALLAMLSATACSGMGSAKLRAADGRFAECDRPNCRSSQSANPARRVEPIRYSITREAAQQLMAKVILAMNNAQIVAQQPGYIHAVFKSETFGFVDDVELEFPPQKFIDVRSSSRTGYYDFGVNRERVETLRKSFTNRLP